jgi:tetratricopeptide (TPR) repeat protein
LKKSSLPRGGKRVLQPKPGRNESAENWFRIDAKLFRAKTWGARLFLAALVLSVLPTARVEAKPVDDYMKKGKQLLEAGHFPAAAADFTKAIEINPKLAEAYQLRGWILFFMGKPEQSIADLNLAVKFDPKRYDSWTARGEVLRQLAKYDDSRKDFDQAIKIDPTKPDAYYLRGLSGLLQGLHVRAQQDFTEAIKRGKNNPYLNFAYYWRGRTEEMQENYKAAIEDFTKSIRMGAPKSRFSEHIDPDAIYMYSAGEGKSTALGLLERGLSYSQIGDHKRAIADLTEVIKSSPKETLLYEKRGNAQLALGKYQDALKDFNRALLLGTESGDVYFHLGLAHFCLKKYTNAASDLTAWFDRTFWEDDKKNPLAATMTFLSMKRTKQDARATKLANDSVKGMSKTAGWRKSVPLMLKAKVSPDQFVSQTDKASLKERTQAHCYAALYLLAESKPKEAQKHLNWIKTQGDRNLLEYTISSAESDQMSKAL